MPIQIGDYMAQGPYETTKGLHTGAGVYVILCVNSTTKVKTVIDVGQSETVKERIAGHDRKSQWNEHCYGDLQVAVIPTNTVDQRLIIEQKLRNTFDPICGER